jgi:uncharacterized lipoprotein YbaY
MKFGLFIGLLVLLASTNVFGARQDKDRPEPVDTTDPTQSDSENTVVKTHQEINISTDRETGGRKQDTTTPRPDEEPETPERSTASTETDDSDSKKPSKSDAELVTSESIKKPIVVLPDVAPEVSRNRVHVSGNIFLLKYDSSAISGVQYDINGARLVNNVAPSVVDSRSQFSQEFVARGSRVILYVSTTKTTDRKSAFAQFPIEYVEDHFPLAFSVDIDLPSQQRGLLDRADITLYFFAYISNPESRIDTFLPYGHSQILLQGTNRLVQKLAVNVRANGVEISGLFRGHYNSQYIQSGTSFQVYIVSEQNLSLIRTGKFESVAQLTITNVPAMFPVAWSLLVQQQLIQSNTKYYAAAFVNRLDSRYLLTQEPVWVINEQKNLVISQVIFAVVPSPFILKGLVTRLMPESFVLQPESSLIIRLHEIGADTPDIIFKLPKLLALPQYFQINVSESTQFNPIKNYDIRAMITDRKNNVYMASLQPIPIPDELTRINLAVGDLVYYTRVHIQSSSNVELHYMPGSSAQIFVTDTPETPAQPIAAVRIDSIEENFQDFSIQIPTTAIQLNHNYYLVIMITSNGVLTHVSKILLISNNQPPPLVVQLPLLSLNLITGVLFDVDSRLAQWSSSSVATIYLLDDQIENPDKAIVQVWKVQLENEFPVPFQVQLDFSRLRSDRVYRIQSSIENGRNVLEYRPAGSVITMTPGRAPFRDLRVPVKNVKTFQSVNGAININGLSGLLPEKGEVLIQVSSSPSLTHPSIVEEIRIKTEGRSLPLDFTINLPLNKININAVYYFLVQYTVNNTVVIPSSQVFAFSPRAEVTVVVTLSQTPQIPITGQVTATGGPLMLPMGTSLYLYITDNVDVSKPLIYSQITLAAASNSIYEFSMYLDAVTVQKQVPLYLVAEIRYEGRVIIAMPRPPLLQLTAGGEWNIHLVADLPTVLVGKIVSLGSREELKGEFDGYIEIVKAGTTTIVQTVRLRLNANLPQDFRVEIKNSLFVQYSKLEARAIIKNCREQILFQSGGNVEIHTGVNVNVDLSVVVTDHKKLTELITIDQTAPVNIGSWQLSVTGVTTNSKFNLVSEVNESKRVIGPL